MKYNIYKWLLPIFLVLGPVLHIYIQLQLPEFNDTQRKMYCENCKCVVVYSYSRNKISEWQIFAPSAEPKVDFSCLNNIDHRVKQSVIQPNMALGACTKVYLVFSALITVIFIILVIASPILSCRPNDMRIQSIHPE
jgi:hypothetical protein